MKIQQHFPEFARANWYTDPRDHRCPHDAWLESVEVTELAQGERSEIRSTKIVIKLLGAYHDGQIIFRYVGVKHFSLEGPACDRGLGDWLNDDFSTTEAGLITHRIVWAGNAGKTTAQWTIECESLNYEWIPQQG